MLQGSNHGDCHGASCVPCVGATSFAAGRAGQSKRTCCGNVRYRPAKGLYVKLGSRQCDSGIRSQREKSSLTVSAQSI
jgi:hypothetical protein